MNLDEAFAKWYAVQDHSGLPWQTSRDELFTVFYAGWHAHIEALKQTDLFPGTWDKDNLRPASLTGQKRIPCSDELSVRVGCGAEVTAEDIYAAYPRKVGKQAAIKAIQKAAKICPKTFIATDVESGGSRKLSPVEYLLDRVQLYAAAVAKWPAADKQFIPHPATWFNRGSYDDDPKEWSRGTATTSQFSKTH